MNGMLFTVTDTFTTLALAPCKPGTTFTDPTTQKSYVFKKVSLASSNACANGKIMYETLADKDIVTDDVSATSANLIVGVGVGTIALGSYGWIQTWGAHTAIVKTVATGDNLVPGDVLVGSATDGTAAKVAAGTAPTYRPIAVATEAVDSATATTAGKIIVTRND